MSDFAFKHALKSLGVNLQYYNHEIHVSVNSEYYFFNTTMPIESFSVFPVFALNLILGKTHDVDIIMVFFVI